MVRVLKKNQSGLLSSVAGMLPGSSARRRPTTTARRRPPSPSKRKGDANDACALCVGVSAVLACMLLIFWGFVTLTSPRPTVHHDHNNVGDPVPHHVRHGSQESHSHSQRRKDDGVGKEATGSQHAGRKTTTLESKISSQHNHPHRKSAGAAPLSNARKPRVIGIYAHPVKDLDDYNWSRRKDAMPYTYVTERIDPYLLSHTSTTLRRMRSHSYFDPEQTTLSEVVQNYNLAISGSHAYVKSEDPLRHLMLSSDSRERLRSIRNGSEDYEESLAEPLEDGECEPTPQHRRWMLHSFPTCNFVHEFDFPLNMRKDRTKLLGNGYWRDVWPAVDTKPQIKRTWMQGKVALKTIRYEHDYTERNFHRHVRDAIVSERLTSSPRVTDIHAFCGNSGFFEFASGGSMEDRIEESYVARMDVEDENGRRRNIDHDERIMSQRDKLEAAHQVALALADFHDAETLRDGKGEIISSAIVHADITTDQFIHVDGVYKLNDFNRCRFMRRYKGSDKDGGDGKPCGFYIMNNPAKKRSPEEYAYEIETEKIDIYSLGNVFYTILTEFDPWEEEHEEDAQQAVMHGERPEVPEEIKSSKDPATVALLKVIHMCWEQKPEDRPRAPQVAEILDEALIAFDKAKKEKGKKRNT